MMCSKYSKNEKTERQ